MSDQTLTKLRRNEVFGALQVAGLDPALLHWESVTSRTPRGASRVSRLVLSSDEEFFYQFDYNQQGSEWGTYSPGAAKRLEESNLGSWTLQLEYFFAWASRLGEELQARDLWAELATYSEGALAEVLLEDDRPISVDEVEAIQASAERLESELRANYVLDDERWKFIQGRLAFLVDSARRQGKVAWVHTALGVFMTIAWAVSPDDVSHYWEIIKGAFRAVVFLIGPGG